MNPHAIQTVELEKASNIKLLMLKFLFKKANKTTPIKLPRTEFCLPDICIQSNKVALFQKVVNWQGEHLHPCYIHTLAFPLHLQLLLQPEFPFPLLGLVHVENSIQQYRPIELSENLELTCRLADLTAHHKGWLFSVITDCTSNDELVWSSVSVNLYRTKHQIQVDEIAKKPVPEFSVDSLTVDWNLATNLGRLYAKSSGDYNPIHLAKWSAKLFGFQQHIIHGMWTKSRCLSELQKQYPAAFAKAFSVQVGFKLPLFLPGKVSMLQTSTSNKSKGEIDFKVQTQINQNESSPHLIGSIQFTDII
ncbi:MaoC/PaaZ C-terminal domain-containing protein [Paraglaciecola sp. L3A3]|uniref:MaoC/PaaZ C-terminal domain-containing protein n=1 Tax=Paraglaciecola sp. L3A3 TaxID=2686358 RepID=UPI00131C40BE|nr:MaoC/PaaZ C-terminal domain-containing protein [Paraglaciecola sp. L3A3]